MHEYLGQHSWRLFESTQAVSDRGDPKSFPDDEPSCHAHLFPCRELPFCLGALAIVSGRRQGRLNIDGQCVELLFI